MHLGTYSWSMLWGVFGAHVVRRVRNPCCGHVRGPSCGTCSVLMLWDVFEARLVGRVRDGVALLWGAEVGFNLVEDCPKAGADCPNVDPILVQIRLRGSRLVPV